jgi:hypothetical protein
MGVGFGVGLPLLLALLASLFFLWTAHKRIRTLQGGRRDASSELKSQLARPDIAKWQPNQEIDSGYIHEAPRTGLADGVASEYTASVHVNSWLEFLSHS